MTEIAAQQPPRAQMALSYGADLPFVVARKAPPQRRRAPVTSENRTARRDSSSLVVPTTPRRPPLYSQLLRLAASSTLLHPASDNTLVMATPATAAQGGEKAVFYADLPFADVLLRATADGATALAHKGVLANFSHVLHGALELDGEGDAQLPGATKKSNGCPPGGAMQVLPLPGKNANDLKLLLGWMYQRSMLDKARARACECVSARRRLTRRRWLHSVHRETFYASASLRASSTCRWRWLSRSAGCCTPRRTALS